MAIVTKEIKKVIEETVDIAMTKISTVTWIERQKAISQETFKNTERLLYNYTALKEHVENEEEYMGMTKKGTAKSIVIYSTGSGKERDELEITKERRESYLRSKSDVQRIEKALKKIKSKKGYEVVAMKYLQKKEDGSSFTFEEIAEELAGKYEYGEKLAERTVRTYRSNLVKEVAIQLFGSDAV